MFVVYHKYKRTSIPKQRGAVKRINALCMRTPYNKSDSSTWIAVGEARTYASIARKPTC
jgi:hypothetical protein